MKGNLAPVALLLAVTGCAGSSTPAPSGDRAGSDGGSTIVIEARADFRFSPDRIEVAAGRPVRVELRNVGEYPHNFVSRALHLRSDDVGTALGAQSTTFTLRADEPGTYRFFCSYHSKAGMTGELVVS